MWVPLPQRGDQREWLESARFGDGNGGRHRLELPPMPTFTMGTVSCEPKTAIVRSRFGTVGIVPKNEALRTVKVVPKDEALRVRWRLR